MKHAVPWVLSIGVLAVLGGAYVFRPRPRTIETTVAPGRVTPTEPATDFVEPKREPPKIVETKKPTFDDCLSNDRFVAHRAIAGLKPSRETNAFLLDYAHSSREDEDRIVAIAAIAYESLHPDELQRFLALLNDPSEEIRIAAVHRTPDEKRLREMMEIDPSERVREEIRQIISP